MLIRSREALTTVENIQRSLISRFAPSMFMRDHGDDPVRVRRGNQMCGFTCSGSCSGGCLGSCSGDCKGGCSGDCSGSRK